MTTERAPTGNRFLDRFARRPVLIAEIGARYAPMETLCEMVTAAQGAGADLVKFQTYRAETISTPGATFTFEDGSVVSQFDFFKAYELTAEDHRTLDAHCGDRGIGWISTPSHREDLALLERFDPIAYKTGSDDVTNLPFLRAIAETGRPILVSTGMATLGEVEAAVEAIRAAGNDQFILLHCVVSYPARAEDANLRVIETFRNAFGVPVGLSDHTTDGLTSILATQMGACVIEKHFCMDYALNLPDSQAALDTAGWAEMIRQVRRVGPALGDGVKRILPTEEKWRKAARKSIFALRPIAAGEVIAEDALTIRRPSDGLHPHLLPMVVGRRARVDIAAGALITLDMLGATDVS